jgi:hypothetical protein
MGEKFSNGKKIVSILGIFEKKANLLSKYGNSLHNRTTLSEK